MPPPIASPCKTSSISPTSLLRALLVTLAFLPLPALALPWAEPGSAQLRADVERLAAEGLIPGPINAWPLPRAQLCGAPIDSPSAAARRVKAYCQTGDGLQVDMAVTSRPALIRPFGATAREQADIVLRSDRQIGPLHLSLAAGYRSGQRGENLHLEPSSLALDLGGWAAYAGYVEQWWGPGHETALLFSTNARPFPKIGLTRLTPKPIDLPLLRSLGPVRLDAFVGVLTEKRTDFDNPALAGIRVAFAPTPGLEIGLNRALQLCGRGRPCDAGTILNAFVGLGNRDNTGTAEEPGNQLAGFDLSYTRSIGDTSLQLYAEAAAEDENNLLIEQFGWLAGANLAGPLASGGSWEARVEYVDTLARKLFNKAGPRPGSFYNHFIYTAGYTYQGQVIGSSLDTDGRMLSLAGALTDTAGRRFYGSLRVITVNRTNRPSHRLSPTRRSFGLLTLGTELPSSDGRFRLETRLSSLDRPAPTTLPATAEIELSWHQRF